MALSLGMISLALLFTLLFAFDGDIYWLVVAIIMFASAIWAVGISPEKYPFANW